MFSEGVFHATHFASANEYRNSISTRHKVETIVLCLLCCAVKGSRPLRRLAPLRRLSPG